VLDGELARGALAAVHDIARAIAAMPAVDAPASDRALYWAYTSAVVDEPFALAAYERAVDDLVADLARGAPHAGLYDGGLAGMAFALGHVLDGEVDGTLAAIDELLVRALDVERWTGHRETVVGLRPESLENVNAGAAAAAGSLIKVCIFGSAVCAF
jgi:hypothetical protein